MPRTEVYPPDKVLIRELRLLLEETKGTPSAWAASQVVIWACSPQMVVARA